MVDNGITPCLLCQAPALEPAYEPLGTRRGITVHICQECGMVQSLPRNVRGDGIPRTSHLADYGNLRTGKLSVARPNLAFIQSRLPGFRPGRVLDVGASRGAFVDLVRDWLPNAHIIAIEPDPKVWPSPPVGVWMNCRIEDCRLTGQPFDLIYCSHSLEHLDDPLAVLKKLRGLIARNGWLMVEVPDILGLMQTVSDLNEELYLDKHVSHFSQATLTLMLEAAGFAILHRDNTPEALTVLAIPAQPRPVGQYGEADVARYIINDYQATLTRNRQALPVRAKALNKVIKDPALIAGGGRILSTLVEAGLDLTLFDGVIDPYLPLTEVHGLPVFGPEMYRTVQPRTVLVCSRNEGLVAEARMGWPGAEVLMWN